VTVALGGTLLAVGFSGAFVAGLLGGLRAWRPAALVAVGTPTYATTTALSLRLGCIQD